MRKRLYEIIEVSKDGDPLSLAYDAIMLCSIIVSIIPLGIKEAPTFLHYTDIVTTILFIFDYIFRLMTADYKLSKKGALSFVVYPFTPWAIIDLISILPTLTVLNSGFKLLRLFRVIRMLRVFRVFKAFRYSKSIRIIANVISKSSSALLAVGSLAVCYVLVSALIIFNVEPESFDTLFDAIYWATVSLTTVGYGDIYPVTTAGRVITMLSSVFGIAVVALPAGIITAGYMNAINEEKKTDKVD